MSQATAYPLKGILPLLSGASSVGAGAPCHIHKFPMQVQAVLSDNSDAEATVIIEASIQAVPTKWFPIVTITMAGAGETVGRAFSCEYFWFRARVSAIGGVGTTVTVTSNGALS